MRRLANVSSHRGKSEKIRVLDDFSQVMVNNGHDLEVVRMSLINGIKGHERKVQRCIRAGKDFTDVRLQVLSRGRRRN